MRLFYRSFTLYALSSANRRMVKLFLSLIHMTRPRCCYRVTFSPKCIRFKPEGKGNFCVVEILSEEVEALRLKNIKGLDQIEAAKEMRVSQSTFQRILASAHKKVSEALIEGKKIKIIT